MNAIKCGQKRRKEEEKRATWIEPKSKNDIYVKRENSSRYIVKTIFLLENNVTLFGK